MKEIRVAAYCRVSKGGVEPEHSLQAQTEYYKEMIESTPNTVWAESMPKSQADCKLRNVRSFKNCFGIADTEKSI